MKNNTKKENTILLINGTPSQDEIAEILQKNDYEVVRSDASQGKNLCEGGKIDLVLMPWSEREPDIIKESHGTPVMCVIEDSASPETVDATYRAGICDHVTSPIVEKALINRVHRQISLIRGQKEAEKTNTDLYEFCMPVSHDLKNQFTSIFMLANSMQEEVPACCEKVHEALEYLATVSADIKQLIENIYAHAEARNRHIGSYKDSVING